MYKSAYMVQIMRIKRDYKRKKTHREVKNVHYIQRFETKKEQKLLLLQKREGFYWVVTRRHGLGFKHTLLMKMRLINIALNNPPICWVSVQTNGLICLQSLKKKILTLVIRLMTLMTKTKHPNLPRISYNHIQYICEYGFHGTWFSAIIPADDSLCVCVCVLTARKSQENVTCISWSCSAGFFEDPHDSRLQDFSFCCRFHWPV